MSADYSVGAFPSKIWMDQKQMILGHLYEHIYQRQPKYVENFLKAAAKLSLSALESAGAKMQGCLAQHCANILEDVNRCTV